MHSFNTLQYCVVNFYPVHQISLWYIDLSTTGHCFRHTAGDLWPGMRDGLDLSITMGKSVHSPRQAELPAFVTSLMEVGFCCF